MSDSTKPQEIWVGLWRGGRRVVFDPSIQPENPEFVLLYFVEGHALCARRRADERNEVTRVHIPDDLEFALEQYAKWLSVNSRVAAEKKSRLEFEIENPPPPNKVCPDCDGYPTWCDAVNKPTYVGITEGPNIIEICPSCNGRGRVSDVL